MKICFVTFEYPPLSQGGASIYAYILMSEMIKLGHEVYIVAPEGKIPPAKMANAHIISVPIIDRPGLRFISFQYSLRNVLSTLLKKIDFDVLHINEMVLVGEKSIPKIVTYHHAIKDIQNRLTLKNKIKGFTGEANPIILLLEKKQLKSVENLIAVSQATKDFLLQQYPIKENQITVIHNGVYPIKYEFTDNELTDFRSTFGVEPSSKLLYCPASRINDPRKGVKYLLQALPIVLEKIDCVCVISGSGNKADFSQYLEHIPASRIKFVGFLDETTKQKIFNSSDIVVLPSLLEGCPLSLLEAMAAGTPIVSSKVGGIPELVKNRRNGLLVEPENYVQLADALLSILTNKEQSDSMRVNNLYDVAEIYRWEKATKLTENVYSKAITMYKKKNQDELR